MTNFTYIHLHSLISLRKITLELSTIRRGTFMKSALKKSVVSTSISLILASGMAAFAAHAADDVKLKATKTNVYKLRRMNVTIQA